MHSSLGHPVFILDAWSFGICEFAQYQIIKYIIIIIIITIVIIIIITCN